MTRRRLVFGLLLLSAVLAGFVGWLWIADNRRAPLARYERVKEGMTREEVIQIVGAPPSRRKILIDPAAGLDVWACEEAMLLIHFDEAGTAARVTVTELQPPTFTERIRRWLGW